jgi:hypothetical protein
MFPTVDGFHWTTWHIGFLVVFFGIATAIGATVLLALWRSRRRLEEGRAESIRWRHEFHDLPERARACRYQLSGRLPHRVCGRGFECDGCSTHARLREGAACAATDENPFGLSYPAGRLYHRGHTWVRTEQDGTVSIGLDALGERLAGTPDAVDLPQVGTRLTANGPGWRMRRNGIGVRVLSPVAGEVVETGGPGAAFYLRVRPAAEGAGLGALLRPSEVGPWLQRELERLQLLMGPSKEAPTLADGGVPVEDLPAACPSADWDAVWGGMFLEP